MKVLLYSRGFFPALGGLESVSRSLAEHIAGAGHHCVVVTETATGDGASPAFPFEIERAPSEWRRLALVKDADIVHANGASLALFFHAKLLNKPFLWTHGGYQMVSVDGLGWVDGAPAPVTPLASLRFHARRDGLRPAAVAALKLGLRRAAGWAVDRNVAITGWVARRQPLPRQVVIYNPFPLSLFKQAAASSASSSSSSLGGPRYDFVFVGRLVTEKGVPTLLRALALVNGRRPSDRAATLSIVGDGPERRNLEQLASSLGLGAAVQFAGSRHGAALAAAMVQGRVGVVPSEWEEPMGGVALELLAAGLPLIVSERGGLAECVADAAWTFPNGDPTALAERMAGALDDPTLRRGKVEKAAAILERFDEARLARQYLDLYAQILTERRDPRARPPSG